MQAVRKINNNAAICMDVKYFDLIGEMPEDVLEFAGQLADVCRSTLSYELSLNLPVTRPRASRFRRTARLPSRPHSLPTLPLGDDLAQAVSLFA